MHWHARIPRHRHLPHYLRTTMLIDAERDDEAVMRAEDQAIAAAAKVEVPPEPLANLMEILTDGREAPVHPSTEGDRRTRGGYDEPAGRV
jgi:hypothetical protein